MVPFTAEKREVQSLFQGSDILQTSVKNKSHTPTWGFWPRVKLPIQKGGNSGCTKVRSNPSRPKSDHSAAYLACGAHDGRICAPMATGQPNPCSSIVCDPWDLSFRLVPTDNDIILPFQIPHVSGISNVPRS